MTHVTCRLTAKNRDELRNPTLRNWVGLWATFTFFTIIDWKFEFDDFLNFVEFTNFLRILKMLMSFKNKIRYREITARTEIFDANVLIQLVIEENSIVMSEESTLAY